MPKSHDGLERLDGERMLGRVGLIVGAILASLALLCAVASGASAEEQRGLFMAGEESGEKAKQPRIEAESYPTYPIGDQDTTHEFGFQIGTLKCPAGDFFGKLSSAATELVLNKAYYYPACTFGAGGWGLTILANGCEEVLTVLNSGPPYAGQYGLKCPGPSPYELTINNTIVKCTFSIPPQTGLTGVTFTNTGEGKKRGVQVVYNVSNLKYSIKGTSFGCKAGSYENGTYKGTMTLEGFNEPY